MPIIDVHTHRFTRRWLELLRASGAPYRVGIRPDGSRVPVLDNAILTRYVATGHLLYTDLNSQAVLAAPVTTTPTLSIGNAVELFDGGFNTNRARDFDVTADGRFVAVHVPGGTAGLREIRLLHNWPREMARVAGTSH